MERRTELESFESRVKLFEAQKSRFNEGSRLLVAVPGLDLKIGENPDLVIEKEIKEAEMFAEHVRKTTNAQVLVLVELDKIDDVLEDKPIDCLIDLHELHSKQLDFIIGKIKKPDESRYSKIIALYP